jgi:C1A family cysteine protease
MKSLNKSFRLLAVVVILSSLVCVNMTKAQTIDLYTTFTEDTIIYPFSHYDIIYGLSITGSVELESDTSLVRVILSDQNGNEWMVYEAYSLILPGGFCDLSDAADETKYLQVNSPYSLEIQIINAELTLKYIQLQTEPSEELESMQEQYKALIEAQKVDSIAYSIEQGEMLWFTDNTTLSNKSYLSKKSIFGYKYNLCGLDYYTGGVYDPAPGVDAPIDDSPLVDYFDWRNRHGMGWLTSIKDQIPYDCDGLCYIYGPLAAIEGVANVFYNNLVNFDLSEQQVLDCDDNDNANQCDQGLVSDTHEEAIETGIVDEDCYPRGDLPEACQLANIPISERLYQVKIAGTFPLYQQPSLTIDDIKEAVINHGPLLTQVKYPDLSIHHSMALVGFKILKVGDKFYDSHDPYGEIIVGKDSDYIGRLVWIYKNSWGTDFGDNGYMLHLHEEEYVHPEYATYYELPIDDILTEDDTIKWYDQDKDGYWNWGISNSFTIPIETCSNLEDSDDSKNRLGPFDNNFYSVPVQPEMKVCWYKDWQPKEYIENNSFFSFDGSDLNNLIDNTFIFRIENPGSAQLNLEEFSTILSTNPGHYEVITDESFSVSICMFDGYTEFKVKYYPDQQNPNAIGVIHIDVDSKDEDVLSDFTFYMAYNDCSPATGLEYISSDTPWNGFDIKKSDYRIVSGFTLTVTGTIGMAEGSDIFVEPGAKIIIDGGCLTGLCGKLWNGIDLWGNPLYSQDERDQGYAVLINGGSIEYAKKGIETAYFDGYSYHRSGGVVYCDSAFFKDNQIGIKFYPYHYSAPGGAEVPNFSRINNTEFEITDNFYSLDYSPVLDPLDGLHISEIWGLNIAGCDFINSSDKTHLIRGNGIYSMNGGYFITKRCTDLVPHVPCSGYELCTFRNHDYGVRAFGDGSEWIIHIDTAEFTENYRGIFMSGINDPIITRSTVNCTDKMDRFDSRDTLAGLYLEYCNRYQVEENSFTSNYSVNGQDAVGIQIVNSLPYYNEVYNNAFNDFPVGITAAGENRDKFGTGLCIKCNDFTSCAVDIYVTPNGGYESDYLGVATNQGRESDPQNPDPTLAAGNTFSQDNGTNPNYTNEEGCNPIIYTYHGNNSSNKKIVPNPYSPPDPSLQIQLNPDNRVTYTEKNDVCPSHLGGGIAIESEKINLIESTASLLEVKDTLSQLIDGGDTESLDFEIQTSLPDEALPLRQELIDHSPYLSDTILKSSMTKEDVLINALLRDILVANPQVAKTPSLLSKLYERNDPLPDYMMEEIMQGQNIYGNKEILESRLAAFQASRDLSLLKVIRYYKTDTTDYIASRDSLRTALENEYYPSARYELAYLYLNKDDSLNTFASLESIPFVFDLTTDEANLHADYEILFDLLWAVHTDTISLDSTQTEQLFNLYESYSLPGIFARNVLVDNQLMYYNEPVYLPVFNKSFVVNDNFPVHKEDETDCLKVFPNPSGNFFVVEYCIENESHQNALLILSDIVGTVRKTWSLKDNQNQLIVPTNDLASGSYILKLTLEGKFKGSTKLIINKQ